jgi:hypothetical protein
MFKVSLPAPRLGLSFEFELDKPLSNPSSEVHDAACKQAAAALANFADTQVQDAKDPSAPFSARVVSSQNLCLNKVHNYPFDPDFHVANGGPAVRYEFFYDKELPKLFLRVVTTFGDLAETVDGVFATRVGLHAMEILQGNEMNKSIFPKHPPFTYGFRHKVNFIQQVRVGGHPWWGYIKMYLCIFLEMLRLKEQPQDMTRVNDMASLFRFQDTDQASDPAVSHSFRSDVGSFKQFLNLVEEWRKALGKTSYFYLINFSPKVAPGVTANIKDIGRLEGRYRGAFAPPGPPPCEAIWLGQNLYCARMIIVNNYGKHRHNFTAKPVGFVWDWLHLANSVSPRRMLDGPKVPPCILSHSLVRTLSTLGQGVSRSMVFSFPGFVECPRHIKVWILPTSWVHQWPKQCKISRGMKPCVRARKGRKSRPLSSLQKAMRSSTDAGQNRYPAHLHYTYKYSIYVFLSIYRRY